MKLLRRLINDMEMQNYYNNQGNIQYIIHFPGSGFDEFQELIKDNIERSFTVSEQLSIISIMNKTCWDESPLRKQCEYNNINIYNTAFSERDWNNTLKIKHILQCLDKVNTPYALLLDGRDAIIASDLDDTFIKKYKTFNKAIVYNGTPAAYPQVVIESLYELLQIKGKQKFLNAGVCIGEVDALKTFYTRCEIINTLIKGNSSEQLIVRKARQEMKDIVGIDHDNYIFRICHQYDTRIEHSENGIILI